MRLLLSLPLLSLVAAAPRQSSTTNSLAQWGEALGRWSAWFQMSAPPPQELMNDTSYYEDKNIVDKLKDAGEFTKFLKIINLDEDVASRLKDSKREMTLLAPNDEAFEHFLDEFGLLHDDKDHDDDKDKKRREWRKKLARQFVLYHVLDLKVEYKYFGLNSTLATALRPDDDTFAGHHRRVKVEGSILPNRVVFNNYASISQQDIRASNGIIQKLDRPLFPPPDIMDQLYMFPGKFSFSAVGFLKVDLQDELEYNSFSHPIGKGRSDRDRNADKRKRGYGSTTTFVPSNQAWQNLPQDLQFFLFSPFGEHAIRKLLEFHTVPDWLVFTEWVSKDKSDGNRENQGHLVGSRDWVCHKTDDDTSFTWEHDFPSLAGQNVHVYSKKSKNYIPGSNGYNWDFRVHGIPVQSHDNVAQNGAIHIIDQVLSPRGKSGRNEEETRNDWIEWKDWFFDWLKDEKEH